MDHRAQFPSTHWSVLLSGKPKGEATQQMLQHLCNRYWYPLYAYLRKRGYSSHDAQDFTQGFLCRLLEKNGLAQVDPVRGKFRSYLLGGLNHYVLDVHKFNRAEKRGGGTIAISIEEELAEQRYQNEPADHLTPEKLFDRAWASALLQDVVDHLKNEYIRKGKERIFAALGDYITVRPDKGTYAGIASKLSLSEDNVRVLVKRIRERYRALLREKVADTVNASDDVDTEIRYLLGAF